MILSKALTLTASEQRRMGEIQRLGSEGTHSVPELIEMLTDPSWVVRRSVVETLGQLGEPAVGPLCDVIRSRRDDEARIAAAVDALVSSRASVEIRVLQLAHDPDPAIVADAAQILGRRRSQSMVPVLVQLTRHGNDNVAVAAIEALGRISGRVAVEALIEAVGSGNFFRTFPAIDILGRSGDPRAVEPLARLLKNPSYLPEAARALGRTGERSAVPPLVGLLKSQSDVVARIAAVALWDLRTRFEEKSGGNAVLLDEIVRSEVGPDEIRHLVRILAPADEAESVAICRLLGAIGNAEAMPGLAALLDAGTAVAQCAAEALRKMGSEAEEPLLRALRHGSSARRKILLPSVTRYSAAADVARCLEDPDPEVRTLACDTLARLANTSVVSRLFPLLADSNLGVVHSATAAIQSLGTREARELAARAALSPNPVTRRSALRILAYFGDDKSLQPILAGLDDADPRVREAAIQGLPYLEDTRALEALLDQTRSPIPRARALSMRSLGQVPKGNERVYSVLLKGLTDLDSWVRYYACQALGRLGYAPAAGEIARLLLDEAGQVRVSAVEALSHLESATAYQLLRQAAESEDAEVRRAALVGLGITRRIEDLGIILSAAAAPDVPTRLVALAAMANFPSSQVLEPLTTAASDPDEQVSASAISFLAARPELEATQALVDLLASDTAHERARTALLVPSEGRVAGLLVALETAGDELASSLVSVLSKLDRPDARSALLAVIHSGNAAARKAAATVFAARREPAMISALQDAMAGDPDPELRQIAALLLRG